MDDNTKTSTLRDSVGTLVLQTSAKEQRDQLAYTFTQHKGAMESTVEETVKLQKGLIASLQRMLDALAENQSDIAYDLTDSHCEDIFCFVNNAQF